MNRLFFPINQNPCDGSAHALYCFRHCWWLAKTKPDWVVEFIYPGQQSAESLLDHYGFVALSNLRCHGLRAMRKDIGSPFTWNWRFHLEVRRLLARSATEGDVLALPGFSKLCCSLLEQEEICKRLRLVYEVHQLVSLDAGPSAKQASAEFAMLKQMDQLMTTTDALKQVLEQATSHPHIANVGLACGFRSDDIPPARARRTEAFTLAYIGSVYQEQGVEWLLKSWAAVQSGCGNAVKLEIIGGKPEQIEQLKAVAAHAKAPDVVFRGRVAPQALGGLLEQIDALVIPPLPVGRMPFVALTKAYDYLGLRRPIVAANLPSVLEVLKPDVHAVFFEAGNAASLATALGCLSQGTADATSLVRNTSKRAQELSWPERAERYWKTIEAIPQAG